MKKAIKLLVVLAVVTVISVFLGVSAFASNFDSQADSLKEMGLFKGTNTGYELDRIPTRAEAATALVRLLGKEAEAQAGTYTIPFTDVPDWAKQYVGYLYANNLTKGTSAVTFGSDGICNEQMFATFVLRALGYNESAGDFTYEEALKYAADIGLIESAEVTGDFTRDGMVALSYSALFQNVKNSTDMTLLEKLAADKAVDTAIADKYMESYEAYQSLMTASAKTGDNTSIQLSNDMEMQLTMNGETQTVSQKSDIAVKQNGSDYIMKMETTTEAVGKSQKLTMYYADGWMYMDVGFGKNKYEYSPKSNELTETIQSAVAKIDDPFYYINSVTKTDTGSGVSYKIVFCAAAMNELLDPVMTAALKGLGDAKMQINALEAVYTFDNGGNLKSIAISGDIGMTMTIDNETVTVAATFQQTQTIIATGDAVVITPPADLDTYKEAETPAA